MFTISYTTEANVQNTGRKCKDVSALCSLIGAIRLIAPNESQTGIKEAGIGIDWVFT